MAPSKSWFTLEDCKMAFNLFCCVYGVGTLGMPGNFSRAGPFLAVCAMVFMALANIYASVVCSKVMLIAPSEVKTFGDLGEWCMGKWGRWIIVVSHTMVCVSIPCLYFVLGGTFLPSLFPDTFSDVTWIIFMALMQTPICLTPTLKEGAGAALAGCLGTILADIVGMAVLFHGMEGHGSVPEPNISVDQVATTFGNLSLGYAASVIIPALQRQHSQPERMPQVVCITMILITILFIAMAWSGYSAVGCQISGNLLFNVFPDAAGITSLGLHARFGSAVIAYLFMQMHVTIAFAVVLYPAFYNAERLVLGMHRGPNVVMDEPTSELLPYRASGTPKDSNTKLSVVDDENDHVHDDSADYKGAGTVLKYVTLRIVIVAILVVVGILLQDHFIDLSDFVGASCVTACAIVLPIMFYQKKMGKQMPMYERVVGLVVMLVCTVLGCYVTYKTGKNLFAPESSDIKFPFCKAEHQMELYYIKP